MNTSLVERTGYNSHADDKCLLSFCITTYNRGSIIRETLLSLLQQCEVDMEVVLVDAGNDGSCAGVVAELAEAHPSLRYFPQPVNSGLDRDFCRAVELARGQYCWLFSDDDIITADAVNRVRKLLGFHPALVVTNAEIRDRTLSRLLSPSMMPLACDEVVAADDQGRLMAVAGRCLSFIGCVVIRRDLWIKRDASPYLGSMFVHVGMIFQAPLPGDSYLMAQPAVIVRHGVASWRPRQFEIWTTLWPDLIWSFVHLPEGSKRAVVRRQPCSKLASLLMYRAKQAYDIAAYKSVVAPRCSHWPTRWAARLIALTPCYLLRLLAVVFIRLARPHACLDRIDLANAGGPLIASLAGEPGQPV